MTENECDQFQGRLQEICLGTAHEHREPRRSWLNIFLLQKSPAALQTVELDLVSKSSSVLAT